MANGVGHCIGRGTGASLSRLREPSQGQRPMLELKPKPAGTLQAKASVDGKQPRRLVLALVLLLVTFVAQIVKDRQFWFGTDESQDADLAQPEVAQPAPAKVAPSTAIARTTPAPAAKKAIPDRYRHHKYRHRIPHARRQDAKRPLSALPPMKKKAKSKIAKQRQNTPTPK